jgi:selenide,water dikinase
MAIDELMNSMTSANVYPLVLLGGGHSHALWLKYWQQLDPTHPAKNIRPLLVSENSTSPYSGMLPGLLSGEYGYDDCHIDLVSLCQQSDCDFLQQSCINIQKVENSDFDTLYRLDFKQNTISEPLSIFCQTLSINIGSQPFSLAADNESSDKTSWKIKPISQFFNNWQSLQQALKDTPVDQDLAVKKIIISIIGAGAAGVEIACAIKLAQQNCQVQILARSPQPLPSFQPKIQQLCLQQLNKMGINFIGQQQVTDMPSDFTILCTQSAAPKWLTNTDLKLSEDGFIWVDKNLQSSLPGVFSAGDCIHFSLLPLAKSGVYAVRQAKTLFHNMCAQLAPVILEPFIPQPKFLSIINMGNHYALAQRGRWSVHGYLPWRYKRYVDRKFMAQFKSAP